MTRLRGALIGGGARSFIGRVHRSAAALDGTAEIVAGVFSRDPDESVRRASELGIATHRAYGSVAEMLRQESALPSPERIQFVIVATPNASHFDFVRASLAAGFHVVCDKPLATSLAGVRVLAAAAARANRSVAVTHGYAGYPMVIEAANRIRSGELGRILKVVVSYAQGWLARLILEPDALRTWHIDPTVSGPACTMMDIGIHAQNLVRTITGLEEELVCADLTSFVPQNPMEDDASVLIRFRGGARGVLLASQIATGEDNNLTIRVYGERAGLAWDQRSPEYLTLLNRDRTATVLTKGSPILSTEAVATGRMPPGHPEGLIEAFANIYRAFYRDIGDGSEEPAPDAFGRKGYPTLADAAAGMAFLEAVLANAAGNEKWTRVAAEPVGGGLARSDVR